MPEEATDAKENAEQTDDGPEGQQHDSGSESREKEPDTFPRPYVEKLRQENADYRVKAKRADDLARALTTAYAQQTGRLHDATDLPFDESMLNDHGVPDRDKVTSAVEALVQAKPHLAKLRVVGDVGQGVQSASDTPLSLGSVLRWAVG